MPKTWKTIIAEYMTEGSQEYLDECLAQVDEEITDTLEAKEKAIRGLIKENHKIGESLNEQTESLRKQQKINNEVLADKCDEMDRLAASHKNEILDARIKEVNGFLLTHNFTTTERVRMEKYLGELTKKKEIKP